MKRSSIEVNYYGILMITALLLVVGLFMVLSASSAQAYRVQHNIYYFFNKQLVGALIGLFLLFLSSRIDYRIWRPASFVLLIFSIGLLLLVFVPGFGREGGGALRWVNLGFISFQPSEFAKLALILFGAEILARRRARNDMKRYLPVGIAALLICGIVYLQRDLGTAVIISVIFLGLLFAGGVRMRYLVSTSLIILLLISGVLLASAFSGRESYRLRRLQTFFNPEGDPRGSGYQIRQSLYAFGSGGIFGKGFGKSRQKFFYLPAASTDFIFAVLGEETGLLGTFLVTLLYFFFGYFGLRVAIGARDFFGRVVAAGICTWVVVQAFINMAAVTHTLPVTGVPLPLISYGGSSLIFTLWGIGILLSIARREREVKVESSGNWRGDRWSRLSCPLRVKQS